MKNASEIFIFKESAVLFKATHIRTNWHKFAQFFAVEWTYCDLEVKMSQKKKAVFMKGLWRGMSGTLNLFAFIEPPAPVKVDVKPLRPIITNSIEATRSDWVQTGRDLDYAIAKYGNKVTSSR